MIIQKQIWHDFTRFVLIYRGVASVQVELYDTEQEFGGTAFIYALWVNADERRKGYAKILLDAAEQIVKENGHKAVMMEWKEKDTPIDVLKWYISRGYDEKSINGKGTYALLKKKLK